MRYDRSLGRLLALCTREHAWDMPADGVGGLLKLVDQSLIPEAAAYHRVSGAVGATLRHEPELEREVAAVLRRDQLDVVATQLRVEADLLSAAAVLEGLPWLVVKGPVLSRHYYSRPNLRSYGDLDLLICPAAFPDAVVALEGSGFTVLDRNWILMRELMAGELQMKTPSGGALDLHWDLTNDRSTRESYRLETNTLLARSRQIELLNQRVRTLDKLDTVVHLAVHGARAGGDRLVWLKDLEQVLLLDQPEWSALGHRAREARAALPLAVMLSRCRSALDASIPPEALNEVGGSDAWRRLVRLVGKLEPVGAAGSGGSLTRMVTSATRDDGRQTTKEFLRRLRAWNQGRHGGRTAKPLPDRLNPTVLRRASGDAADRRLFLDSVARGGEAS